MIDFQLDGVFFSNIAAVILLTLFFGMLIK